MFETKQKSRVRIGRWRRSDWGLDRCCRPEDGRGEPRLGGFEECARQKTAQQESQEKERGANFEPEKVEVEVGEARLTGEEGNGGGEDCEGDEALAVHGWTWKSHFIG